MFIKILTIVVSALVVLYGGWRMLTSASDQLVIGKAIVIDGDTLDVGGERILLYGVDAPELDQVCDYRGTKWLCGRKAARELSAWLAQAIVVCRRRDKVTASCVKMGIDVAGWSVRRGLAVADECRSGSYERQQEVARVDHAGIWASTFELPRSWRQKRRSHSDQATSNC